MAAKRRIEGFTLIEMMVVIGIIAILGAFVVPGFKKAYADYKMREACSLIDIAILSHRSFYLIFNEAPSLNTASSMWSIDIRMAPFLLGSWVDKKTLYYGYCRLTFPAIDGFGWGAELGEFKVRLWCYKRPSYEWGNLLTLYREKGYEVKSGEGYDSFIYLPEDPGKNVNFFR